MLPPYYQYQNRAALDAAASGDPYWASVVLLVGNDNQADGTTTFDDQSDSNHTVTRNGDAQYDTAQAPTGMTSSVLFDGTGDGLSVADHADFNFGSGAFTIEGMIRPSSTTGLHTVLGKRAATGFNWIYILTNGTALVWYASSNGTSWDIASGLSIGTVAVNTWYHFALVRNGSDWVPYLAGTAGAGTASSASSLNVDVGNLRIGLGDAAVGAWAGWQCPTRITKGVARYTANFTPPSLPLPTS